MQKSITINIWWWTLNKSTKTPTHIKSVSEIYWSSWSRRSVVCRAWNRQSLIQKSFEFIQHLFGLSCILEYALCSSTFWLLENNCQVMTSFTSCCHLMVGTAGFLNSDENNIAFLWEWVLRWLSSTISHNDLSSHWLSIIAICSFFSSFYPNLRCS